MIGAIAGDIIGSVHEFSGRKSKRFLLFVDDSCFTDDSVLSIAVADCLLSGCSYVDAFHSYARKYPYAARRFAVGQRQDHGSPTTVGTMVPREPGGWMLARSLRLNRRNGARPTAILLFDPT